MSTKLSVPTCPRCLNAEARVEWKRIVAELQRLGVLAKIDRALLSSYCQAWSQFVELTKRIDNEGYVIETIQGNVIQNPVVGAHHRAVERLHKLALQFGLSPLARSRIEINDEPDADAFKTFLGGKAKTA